MIGIGFSTTNHFLSKIIRLVIKSKFSHVWIYIKEDKKETVLESTFGGVHEISFESFKHGKSAYKILDPKQDLSCGLAFARSLIGTSYDDDELVGGLWVQIGRWLKKKFHNPFSEPKEMDCAHFVMLFLQACKYPGSEKFIPGDTEPKDIYKLCSK